MPHLPTPTPPGGIRANSASCNPYHRTASFSSVTDVYTYLLPGSLCSVLFHLPPTLVFCLMPLPSLHSPVNRPLFPILPPLPSCLSPARWYFYLTRGPLPGTVRLLLNRPVHFMREGKDEAERDKYKHMQRRCGEMELQRAH